MELDQSLLDQALLDHIASDYWEDLDDSELGEIYQTLKPEEESPNADNPKFNLNDSFYGKVNLSENAHELYRRETQFIIEHDASHSVNDQLIILNHIAQALIGIERRINQSRETQRRILIQNAQLDMDFHDSVLNHLDRDIHTEIAYLNNALKVCILDSETLLKIRMAIMKLRYFIDRVDVLQKEMLAFMSNTHPSIFKLSIVSHPITLVLFKGKPQPDYFSVTLIAGELADMQHLQDVKASLVSDNFTYKSNKDPLGGNVAKFDAEDGNAYFSDLFVNISTRMNLISIRFDTSVLSFNEMHSVISEVSSPFIVITNESQWCEAAGKVFNREVFAESRHVTWEFFINSIHIFYLKSSNQIEKLHRPLYRYELMHLHRRFLSSAAIITEASVSSFWTWFGQCIHTIRFKRHIRKMWLSGCIMGFISKEEVTRLLTFHPKGTFVIRFSESNPGIFSIAYSAGNGDVVHYLIRGEDIGSNKSLAEFLRIRSQFKYLLQFNKNEQSVIRITKNDALGEFYSKKKNSVPGSYGYNVL